MRSLSKLVAVLLTALAPVGAQAADPTAVHGIAMHGEPKYPAGFKHFDYVNPEAPKGGDVRFAAIGSFDSLNPYILKGVPAAAAAYLFDTLMVSAEDEAFTEYGLIAESLEVPENRSWVIFNLRPEARFHDGTPVTAADVVFTFDTLKSKGHPSYRAYYADVKQAEALAERRVKFSFAEGDNRELPLIIGQLPVFSKAYYSKVEFDATTLEPPVGSGPYKVQKVDAGRSITMVRDPAYWGRDVPVNRGRYNFGTMRYDYYRDSTVAVEALKAGQYDLRQENSSKDWATAYDVPAIASGQLVKEEIRNQLPSGMQGFAFNMRRTTFQDPKVRQALAYAFDFEWTNRTLFYGLYARTRSYFDNSELEAQGLPSKEELVYLEPLKAHLPAELFTEEYQPPKTDGSGNLRDNIRIALRLLREAGWEVKNNKLVNKAGVPMEFEVLLSSPLFERIVLPFARNLERIGVTARVRTVDPAQYQRRMDGFDFDVTVGLWGQSLSPGNEQRDFWSSQSADIQGSRNIAGIKSPAIDALINLVISAPDRESLIFRTRALDRALQWGHYVIPQWHSPVNRFVYWNIFSHPSRQTKYGLSLATWWVDQAKLAGMTQRKNNAGPQEPSKTE